MLTKYQERYAEATQYVMKKKINVFRTSVRKELRKIKNSQKSGSAEDKIYVPNLWYFHDLDFTADQEVPAEGISKITTGSILVRQTKSFFW